MTTPIVIMALRVLSDKKEGWKAVGTLSSTHSQDLRIIEAKAGIRSIHEAKALAYHMNVGEMPWDRAGIFIDGSEVIVPAANYKRGSVCNGTHHRPRCLGVGCHYEADGFPREKREPKPEIDEPKIVHWRELLQNIAAGVSHHELASPSSMEVILRDGDGEVVLKAGIATVLDYIASDLYWNEESDWSDARTAEVSVF